MSFIMLTGTMEATAKRTVFCEDALDWLRKQPSLAGCSVITSLPDRSEFPRMELEAWKAWFVDAAETILSRCAPEGVAIFYQTDIKVDGAWIDKGYLCQKAAERTGHSLLWHKIACRHKPGSTTFGRPAYSHLLCFSRGVRVDLSKAVPDVLPDAGPTSWTRGMGAEACRLACEFVLAQTTTRTIVAPFCGHGSALVVANALGLDAVGIEISAKRARKASSAVRIR
ncbi:MAG: SAM-dependent methyltransferase [Deltaproteobacteria bacterium]|nr:SAM-dependent methyltransferase [Deltaproteobacteria bacterium]